MVPDLNIALVRAFIAVVDERTVTAAARRLRRTQPAVTLQIKRLEAVLGKCLFERNHRRLTITQDGELLLPLARELLRVNDEARTLLSQPEIKGRVVLGTPDLYAACLLPAVLANFSRSYPGIEIELRCTLSSRLHQAIADSEIDLALLTKMNELFDGDFVRREPLVWLAHPESRLQEEAVLPLAMLPQGIYRDLALKALDDASRAWRIVCISESIAGLQAPVFAGLAITVLIRSAAGAGMRILGPKDGLPRLPEVELVLRQKQGPGSDVTTCLAEYIMEHLGSAGLAKGDTSHTCPNSPLIKSVPSDSLVP